MWPVQMFNHELVDEGIPGAIIHEVLDVAFGLFDQQVEWLPLIFLYNFRFFDLEKANPFVHESTPVFEQQFPQSFSKVLTDVFIPWLLGEFEGKHVYFPKQRLVLIEFLR